MRSLGLPISFGDCDQVAVPAPIEERGIASGICDTQQIKLLCDRSFGIYSAVFRPPARPIGGAILWLRSRADILSIHDGPSHQLQFGVKQLFVHLINELMLLDVNGGLVPDWPGIHPICGFEQGDRNDATTVENLPNER